MHFVDSHYQLLMVIAVLHLVYENCSGVVDYETPVGRVRIVRGAYPACTMGLPTGYRMAKWILFCSK